jgi:hypothetical protein
MAIGEHQSLSPDLGFPIRPAIPPSASDSAGLLGQQLLRQHNVPFGIELLLRDHVPGLQRYSSLAQASRA